MSLEYSTVSEKLRNSCSSLLILVTSAYSHEDLLDAVLLADDVAAAQQLESQQPLGEHLGWKQGDEVEDQHASAVS
jgi:hypothetical protein